MSGIELFNERFSKLARQYFERMKSIKGGEQFLTESHMLSLGRIKKRTVHITIPKKIEYEVQIMTLFDSVVLAKERLKKLRLVRISYDHNKNEDLIHNKFSHKSHLIRFKYELLLNETYIIHQRLKLLSNTIKNDYSKDKTQKQLLAISNKAQAIGNVVDDFFKNISETRGYHVHRISFDTQEINQLEQFAMSLYMYTKSTGKKAFHGRWLRKEFKEKYNECQKKYRNTLASNIKSLDTLVDKIFEELLAVLYTPNKLFIPPVKIRDRIT